VHGSGARFVVRVTVADPWRHDVRETLCMPGECRCEFGQVMPELPVGKPEKVYVQTWMQSSERTVELRPADRRKLRRRMAA
jgi:hypothetical protein